MDLIEGGIENPISHWYYKHKFWAIKKYLKKIPNPIELLVDVGAGSALFSKEILKENPKVNAVAVDTGYAGSSVDVDNPRLRYDRDGFSYQGDLYLFTDVLEHVPDDHKFLKEYVNAAKSDSFFIITVPAFKSLWSRHDVYLKHFRRYTKNELLEVVRQSNLKIMESQYLYSLLFPVAFIKRKLIRSKSKNSEMKDDSKLIQFILNKILFFDRVVAKVFPFGISIIVLAQKK